MDDVLVGAAVAAREFGVTSSTLRRWVRDGDVVPDAVTLGGHYRFYLSTLRVRLTVRESIR